MTSNIILAIISVAVIIVKLLGKSSNNNIVSAAVVSAAGGGGESGGGKKGYALKEAMKKQQCKMNGYKLPLKLPDCYETEVHLNTCVGACISANAPFFTNDFSENARCCKVAEYREVHVRLKCQYKFVFHTLRTATKCHCVKCWDCKGYTA